jgi:hypothetical protein
MVARMRSLRALIAALCLTISGVGAAAPASFDRAAWLADYAALKTAMERSQSHLAWLASPESGVDLPALDRRAMRALQSAESDGDAEAAIRDFVRSVHDGVRRG